MIMDINNYSFKYTQLSQSRHPMMPAIFEGIITDNVNRVSYGTKFQHPPGQQVNNEAMFNAFKDKNGFNQNWWVELEEIKKPEEKVEAIQEEVKIDVLENKVDDAPESAKVDVETKKEEENAEQNQIEPQTTNN